MVASATGNDDCVTQRFFVATSLIREVATMSSSV